jgi:hypothetical protein
VKEQGQGSPEGAPKSQSKPNHPEQLSHTGGIRSAERQILPSAWDLLERKARASDELLRGRMSRAEYDGQQDEMERLKVEIDEKGIDRDKHILALLYDRTPRLSLLSQQQQMQQWRSQVETLSDHDIAACAHKQKEEIDAFQRGEVYILAFHSSAGDGELILAKHIAKKGKRE